MIGYCAEHKDQRKDSFLAAITTDCHYCRIAELEQQLADEKKAAGHWMEQSCKDHNRAEKLEQQLARYQGAVEVEGCWITDRGNIHVPSCNQSLDHIEANTKVRVLVMKEVEVEGMKVPNWRESSPELKAAWFEFKSKYTGAGTPCLSSFAAGWNMQKQPPTAQLAERDAEIERLKRKAQDAEKNVRKQMLDRAGRGLERYSITAEDGEVHCKPDPDGFYVTMGTVTALVEQLSTSQQEIARLQQQSVGWVQVFDENASLREEVGRLKGSSMWRSKHSNTFHCDCSECVTTTKSREKIREEGRKQAAQEIYNSLQKCFWAVDFETVRANLKHKFGLEG